MSGELTADRSSISLRPRVRYAWHVCWDHMADPAPRSDDDTPWRAEAITPEWLTGNLCQGTPGATVERVVVVGGSDGSSIRRYLDVSYNDQGHEAGLPRRIFVKSTPTLSTRLGTGSIAALEARFYIEIRPQLDIEAPELLFSRHSSDSGRTVHVFRDLVSERGASFCTPATSISSRHAEQIVDTLAEVHGSFHGVADSDVDLEWIPAYEWFPQWGARQGFEAFHDKAMLEAMEVIPADVTKRRDELWPKYLENLAVHAQAPRTLLHSDVHLGNWYITDANQMGLTDWQLACWGHWSRDLAYALSTCLDVEQRRVLEEPLIQRYLARMAELCGLTTSLDEAFTFYRKQLFAALMMWTPTLCPPPALPQAMQSAEMSRLMIARICTAISDLHALDAG